MRRLFSLVCLVGLAGCGAEEVADSPGLSGSRGVTQGGAQDIALFRQIVERGEVPAPATLDPVGFFAEHALDLPPADCGEDICLHPMLAVAPRFDGGNWTMAFVAMNSPVDPSTLERPPLHLVLALERSFRTDSVWRGAELGARALATRLRVGDRLSIVTFGRSPSVHLRAEDPTPFTVDAALRAARDVPPSDAVALYDGLAAAGRLTQAAEDFTGATRIVLLTSGQADAGITTPERIVELGAAWARRGTAINVIGAGGVSYDPRTPQLLGELGAGTYSVAEDAADLDSILRFEGDTTMFPLATGFRLDIEPAAGYRVGRIYGARRAVAGDERATLSSPALFLGHRTGSDDVGGGRRGGGGGLFVELIPDPAEADIGAGQPAFVLNASWTASDGTPRTVRQTMVNGLAPGQNPDGMWPALSDEAHGNAFMMLNMYLTLRTAVDFHHAGDCSRALGVIDLVAPTVEIWQAEYANPDIWADFDLVLALRDNIETQCSVSAVQPQYFHGGCFGI